MGIAGEIGYNRLDKDEGTGSLKVKILDAIYHLSEEDILKWGKFMKYNINYKLYLVTDKNILIEKLGNGGSRGYRGRRDDRSA